MFLRYLNREYKKYDKFNNHPVEVNRLFFNFKNEKNNNL